MKMDDRIIYQKIKKEIEEEKIPENYEKNVKHILEHLPEKQERKSNYVIFKYVAMFILVILLSTTTAIAGAYLINLGKGKIQNNNSSLQYRKIVKLDAIEENIGNVGVSKKDKGISLTVDQIGIDEGTVIIYYSIETDKKRSLPGESWETDRTRLQYVFSDSRLKINGNVLENMEVTNEIYQESDNKIRGVIRQNMSEKLGKAVDVDFIANRIWGEKGSWEISMKVDRSNVIDHSLRVDVGQKITNSIILSPLGNVIEINNGYKNRKFILKTDHDQYLYYNIDGVGENVNTYCNFFANDAFSSLQLIPIKTIKNTDTIERLKLKQDEEVAISKHTRLKIEKVEKNKKQLRVICKIKSYDGILLNQGREEDVLELDEQEKGEVSMDMWIDYENERLVFDFYDLTQKTNFTKAKSMKFSKQEVVLDETKAETIRIGNLY